MTGTTSLSDPLREGALELVRVLRAEGFEAYWAGGCVRDLVLGRAPKDYDIATGAPPEVVLATFPKAIPVGVQFGVVRVVHHGLMYEVATFRTDYGYVDGRRPSEVRWAEAREDVLRRDFTINGLLFDPVNAQVIDFVGGQADLAAGILRAIGDAHARFGEDALRLVRAVRFAARLGFVVAPETWQAMRALAPTVLRVSAERVQDELTKTLTQGHPARGLELLWQSGLGPFVLPELGGEGDVHAAITRLAHLGACEPMVGWAATLFARDGVAAQAEAKVEAVASRLKFARALARDVTQAIVGVQNILRWPALTVAERKRAARLPTFAGGALPVARTIDHAQAEAARQEAARWTPAELHPTPLLDGHALAARGYRPGPAFKAALEAVETAQLEGAVTTADDAWTVAARCLTRDPDAP